MDPSLSVDARQPDSHRQLQLQGLRKKWKTKDEQAKSRKRQGKNNAQKI
jgi:hypothetical protein